MELIDGAVLKSLGIIMASLGRIEALLWIIAALLGVIALLLFLRFRAAARSDTTSDENWQSEVEQAYEKADYETALDILDTAALLFPGSALVEYWRGRCYFQREEWQSAASAFEALLRREPIYRRSVKDYLAFIELNELVPGVEGYVDASDE